VSRPIKEKPTSGSAGVSPASGIARELRTRRRDAGAPQVLRPARPGATVLVAGIGNIFFGDDAFGIEVIRCLSRHQFPSQVRVADFGISSYALAYALTDGYETAVLVDAVPRGGKPGTLYLLELDPNELGQLPATMVNPHSMNPVQVLQLAQSLGHIPRRLYLLGCEPGGLGSEEGHMGLSEQVRAAVPGAVEKILSLVTELLDDDLPESCSRAQAR